MNTNTQTTANEIQNLSARGAKVVTLRANVRQYILDCIDSSGYDITTTTDAEKLQFLADTFNSEYVFKDNLKYYGSYQNMFANWLMGLPSSFNIEFRNHYIIEIAKKWNSIPENATEKQEDKIIENWFLFIASHTEQLCRKHKVQLFRPCVK